MDGFEIGELVVVCIYAGAEEETGVPAVDYLGALTELDEVGLVFLVARGYEAVDLVERLLAREFAMSWEGRAACDDCLPRPLV